MLFHTHEFLALLALTLLLFYALSIRRRQAVLLVASLAFYAYSGLGASVLFLSVAFLSYQCLRWIREGRRWALPLGVAANFTNLFTFKYTLFFFDALSGLGFNVAAQHEWVAANVVLPVGISFYTFQLVAALIDQHRGQELGVQSFAEFLLFITFFGQLIAGPIMRGREFFPQLHRLEGATPNQVISGALLFGTGLIKKVIFAT